MTLASPLAGLAPSAVRRHRTEVLIAAERSTDAAMMLRAASAAVARYVPSDASGWSVTDPGTMLPTWPMHLDCVAFKTGSEYWDREFLVDDSLLFRDLAARAIPVGRLRAETSGLLARSSRYRESFAVLGFGDELRAVLRVSGMVWGFVELVRGDDKGPFSDVEAAFIASLIEPLAVMLRDKVIRTPSGLAVPVNRPGLLMFDSAGELTVVNDAARDWLREMPNLLGDPEDLPSPVRAVLAYAHAVASGHQRGPARARVRVRSGQWAVLDASSLRTADGSVGSTAVVIEPATPAELASIIVSAYDLSRREQEVARLLARGTSTAEIAAELCLSAFTVRDHIKSIFTKVRVTSRGELVAQLFTNHYR